MPISPPLFSLFLCSLVYVLLRKSGEGIFFFPPKVRSCVKRAFFLTDNKFGSTYTLTYSLCISVLLKLWCVLVTSFFMMNAGRKQDFILPYCFQLFPPNEAECRSDTLPFQRTKVNGELWYQTLTYTFSIQSHSTDVKCTSPQVWKVPLLKQFYLLPGVPLTRVDLRNVSLHKMLSRTFRVHIYPWDASVCFLLPKRGPLVYTASRSSVPMSSRATRKENHLCSFKSATKQKLSYSLDTVNLLHRFFVLYQGQEISQSIGVEPRELYDKLKSSEGKLVQFFFSHPFCFPQDTYRALDRRQLKLSHLLSASNGSMRENTSDVIRLGTPIEISLVTACLGVSDLHRRTIGNPLDSSSKASLSDREAIKCFFPALHHRVVYQTLDEFEAHCRSAEHYLECCGALFFPVVETSKSFSNSSVAESLSTAVDSSPFPDEAANMESTVSPPEIVLFPRVPSKPLPLELFARFHHVLLIFFCQLPLWNVQELPVESFELEGAKWWCTSPACFQVKQKWNCLILWLSHFIAATAANLVWKRLSRNLPVYFEVESRKCSDGDTCEEGLEELQMGKGTTSVGFGAFYASNSENGSEKVLSDPLFVPQAEEVGEDVEKCSEEEAGYVCWTSWPSVVCWMRAALHEPCKSLLIFSRTSNKTEVEGESEIEVECEAKRSGNQVFGEIVVRLSYTVVRMCREAEKEHRWALISESRDAANFCSDKEDDARSESISAGHKRQNTENISPMPIKKLRREEPVSAFVNFSSTVDSAKQDADASSQKEKNSTDTYYLLAELIMRSES